MATSEKVLNEKLREDIVKVVTDFLVSNGEEVLRIKSNELAMPVVDSENNDKWVQIIVKVPNGSRDGEPFDGYSLQEEYEMKKTAKAEKAKIAAEKKAKKIEQDKLLREQRKKLKEKRENGGN